MSENNGVKPTFDFSRVSRKWHKDFLASTSKATRATMAIQRPMKPNATPDEIQAHYDRVEQALVDLQQLSDEQAALVAQVLASVPVEWLIEGAPQSLDWHNPDSLDWVQADRYEAILMQLQTRQSSEREEARRNAKN